MFPHNKTFLSKFNTIIKNTQCEIMNLIIETANDEINSCEKQIEDLKLKLVNDTLYTNDNISAYVNKLFSKVELSLEKVFRDSDEKLKEIINSKTPTEYSVLTTPRNHTLDSSRNSSSSIINGNRSNKKSKISNNNNNFTPSSILKSTNGSHQRQSFNNSNYSSNSNANRSRHSMNNNSYQNYNFKKKFQNKTRDNSYNNANNEHSTPNRNNYFHKRKTNNQYNRHH